MYCPSCGKQIPIDSKFCGFCGANITKHPEDISREQPGYKSTADIEESALSHQGLQMSLLLNEARSVANKMILGGVGWIIAGLTITGITYSMAEPGGTYYVFWGLSIYGAYRLIKGIYYRVTPHKLIEEALPNVAAESEHQENKS